MTMITKFQKVSKDDYLNNIWYWDKKPVKIEKLNSSQIDTIKKLLTNYYPSIRYVNNKAIIVSRMYYGKSSDYWLKIIKKVEVKNNFNTFKEAIYIIKSKKIEKAEKNVDEIINYITTKIITHV